MHQASGRPIRQLEVGEVRRETAFPKLPRPNLHPDDFRLAQHRRYRSRRRRRRYQSRDDRNIIHCPRDDRTLVTADFSRSDEDLTAFGALGVEDSGERRVLRGVEVVWRASSAHI